MSRSTFILRQSCMGKFLIPRIPKSAFTTSSQANAWRPKIQSTLRSTFRGGRSQQVRHASSIPFMPGAGYLRYTMRRHPILFPVAIAGVIFGATGFLWSAYTYLKMYNDMATYPEKVGLKLRRAIYFTDVNPDPAQAVKAYVQALQLAAEENMDPLSDEVIGIKADLTRCLEKSGNPQNAVVILEALKQGCLDWIAAHGNEPGSAGRRTKLLSWACKIATRQADLYSNPYIADHRKAEETLVWAVETTVRERQRRVNEGLKEGEGEWLSDDDHGSQLEALGHIYEERDNHYFAAQLFLQALMIKPRKDCHTVVLMNNLAAAIAQQVPPVEPGSTPPSSAQLRESGRAWIRQALALAESIEPPKRTDECDQACAVAIHNLGEFAEMDGYIKEAREKFDEAASIAHAIGFHEGVQNAEEGLKRLDASKQKRARSWF